MKYEQQLAEHFSSEGIITLEEASAISEQLQHKKFSLHWELRVLLYVGITLFTSGLGIFIYNNIGSIGHIVLILLLFAGCAAGYLYAFKKALPYSRDVVEHTDPFYDYTVLLGALLFVSAQGYVQYRFEIYGAHWSMPTLVSSFVLYATAFRFDHKGVLSVAISLFAAFFGLVVTPLEWMQSPDFEVGDQAYIQSAIVLGLLLYGFGWISRRQQVKAHFTGIFFLFSVNILLIAFLSGTFSSHLSGLYYIGLLLCGVLFVWEAKKEQSFALFLSVVLAEYIGLSYWIIKGLIEVDSVLIVYLCFMYLVASGIGIIYVLRNHKKLLGYATI